MTEQDEYYEKWDGPIRSVRRRGGRKIPLAPPLPGETDPFVYAIEGDELVSMDLDGRAIEKQIIAIEDGVPKWTVHFKDGGEVQLPIEALKNEGACSPQSTHGDT